MKVYLSCKSIPLEKAIICELNDKGVEVVKLTENDKIPFESCSIIECSMVNHLTFPDESDMSNIIIVGYEDEFELFNLNNYYRKLIRPFNLDDMCKMIFKDENPIPLIIPISVNLIDKLKFDDTKRTVSLYGKTQKFSKKQYALFCYLYENKGKACSREEVFNNVWPEGASDIYVVDTYICYLRKRVEESLGYPKIINMRNQGYMIK